MAIVPIWRFSWRFARIGLTLMESLTVLYSPNATEKSDSDQIDRFKELARELGCDQDEAAFEATLAEVKALSKHEPKKRTPKGDSANRR